MQYLNPSEDLGFSGDLRGFGRLKGFLNGRLKGFNRFDLIIIKINNVSCLKLIVINLKLMFLVLKSTEP